MRYVVHSLKDGVYEEFFGSLVDQTTGVAFMRLYYVFLPGEHHGNCLHVIQELFKEEDDV